MKCAKAAKREQSDEFWIPDAALHYLSHIQLGRSLRDIARDTGHHASTILRRVRRYENRRDDPLVDGALDRLGAAKVCNGLDEFKKEEPSKMSASLHAEFNHSNAANLSAETLRVLRRLAETGAVLAVAKEMDKAVVVRELPGGKTTRTTVVDREVAEVMALNEWITCPEPGRIAKYRITGQGRDALKRLLGTESGRHGLDEAPQTFQGARSAYEDRTILDPDTNQMRRVKHNIAESPLTAMGRRKDKNGAPFLSDDLIAAGERLREDFELSQMGARVTQNWERFLTSGGKPGVSGGSVPGGAGQSARERVSRALGDLGPGLGDVALRCCCFLEGIETTEKTMGWSARSGKIVLRTALQRLKRHYEDAHGRFGPMIG